MTYTVHELFYSLQGEGANAGRPAVFCRFAGCNLWTGHEQDRASAVCRFCDTDFRGGTKYRRAGALASAIRDLWPGGRPALVVFTGGEPTLQLDAELVEACHWAGFTVAMMAACTDTPSALHSVAQSNPAKEPHDARPDPPPSQPDPRAAPR